MTETWRPVPGYEGRYEVSDDGAIYSQLSHRLLTPYMHSVGYLAVALRDARGQRTTTYVHRIVAAAFLGEPGEGEEVCHRDGDAVNNSATNLYWGTRADNMRDAVRHGTHHQSSKTHCKRGHEFTPENTIQTGAGHRRCRTCQRANQATYDARKKADA